MTITTRLRPDHLAHAREVAARPDRWAVDVGPLSDVDFVDGGSRARLSRRDFGAGGGRHFGRSHIHRITNEGDGPALSTMSRHHLAAGRLRPVAVDRAGSAW
jgi:hypothetical protein